MTRALQATCENNIVKISGLTVEEAQVLSKGIGSSSGVCIISHDKVFYLPNSVSDLESTLTKMAAAITKIATIFTSIGAGMTGPTTAPPGTLVTDVVELNTMVTEINTLKGQLK